VATDHNFRIKNGLHVQGGTATFHSVNNNSDLVVGGVINSHDSGSPARITTSSTGQLYLDSTSGQDLYLGWWNSSDANIITEMKLRAPALYDRNNTSYYVNPATNSVLNDIDMRGTNTKLPGHAYSNTHDNTNTYWHIGLGNESTNHVLNLRVFNSSNSYVNHRFMATGADIVGNLNVTGNLTVTGSIDRNSVTDLDVVDKTITVGVGQSDANSGGSGLIVAGSGAQLLWDYGDNRWEMNENFYITGHVTSGSHMSSNIFYNTGDYRTLNTAGSGWDTVIARNGGSPYADMKHSYRMNGTTVIDGSRNTSFNNSNAVSFLSTNGYWVGGTRRIDGSGNLENIGTISSGAITTSGAITQSTGQSHYFRGVDNNWRIGSDIVSDSGGLITGAATQMIVGGSANTYGFQIFGHQTSTSPCFEVIPNSSVANSITNVRGSLYVANTQVIDSSRNLTNIGTISNTGKHSSSIGSSATYSRPLLEITSSGTPTQIKITTNIPYSGGSTHAHSVTIRGFQYASANTVDLQISWHVYNSSFYNRTATSSGAWAPVITLAVENNKVVIHLAGPGYWPKMYVESMYNAYGGASQAGSWSWSDAAISADANTPNQTVPYKSAFGNGISMSSSGLTAGTISSGAITSSGAISGTNGTFSGSLALSADSSQLQLGTGNRAQIFHNSAALYLRTSTGGVNVQASALNHYSADASTLYFSAGSGGLSFGGTQFLTSSRNLSNIGTISSGVITVNGGTTNVVANFISTDGTAGIKLQDNAGNVELSAVGTTFQVQPSGGAWKLSVDASGNTTAMGYLQHYGNLYSRDNLRVLNNAGDGWHTWATRSSGNFNLSVGTIVTGGALTVTGAGAFRYSSMEQISLSPTSTGGVLNVRNSSGTSVAVLDGRGTPFIDVTGNLKVSATQAIHKSGNYMVYGDGSGNAAFYAGNTADNRNYYQATYHRWRSDDATTAFGEMSATGLVIGGTFTPTQRLHVEGNARINQPDLGGAPGMTALLEMYGYEGRGVGIKMRDNVNNAGGGTNREWFVGTGYAQTGFNIGYSSTGSQSSYAAQNKLSIDTSGNVTVAGTISSGAATLTSGNRVLTLLISGQSVTDDNAGFTIREKDTYSDGRYEHRFRKKDEGGGIPLYIDKTEHIAGTHAQIARFGSYTSNSDEFEVYGTMSSDGYRINNTQVIDSSRNLSNIGTISSGAITSSSAINGTYFSDGYIQWTAAQLNRYGAAIELQFTPTNAATLVKIGANGSNPTTFNAYTGAATFSGTISSGAITSSGNIAITAGSGQRYIEIGSGTTGAKTWRIYNGIGWNPDALLIYDHTSDSTALTIEPGKLGINRGASSLSHTLDVGGNVAISGTEIITATRVINNVTLGSGTAGARFQVNAWHYDTNNDARFYFEANGRTYYRSDTGHHFRANGDTTRLTISQSGGINLFSAGDTQAGTGEVINVAGTNILTSSRQLKNVELHSGVTAGSSSGVAPAIRGTAAINSSGYTHAFKVDGGGLASQIRFTVGGTTGNVVLNDDVFVSVNHSYDILVESTSGFYTQLTVKIVSNGNEDFSVFLKTNHANTATVSIVVFPLNDEVITFTSTDPGYSTQTLEHVCERGKAFSSADTGAGRANMSIGGDLAVGDGTASLPSLSFGSDQNTGLYRSASDNLGFAIGGTAAGFFSTTQFNVTPKIISGTDMRAPIFYDNDNTAYYTSPNTTSIMNSVYMGTALVVGATAAQSAMGQIAVASVGNPYISFHGGGDTTRDAYFQYLTDHDRFYHGEVAYTETAGSYRAPLFYDSADTGFYIDPKGTSKLYDTLFLGHTNSQPGKLTLYDTGNNRLEIKGTGSNTFSMDLEGTGSDGFLSITQFNVGIGASTDASHRLKVSTYGHNYLWIESTNGTNEAMTRYKNPTSNNWYTGIRNLTQNSLTNTSYHVYSSAFGATTGGWNASGQFFTANEGYALGSFRAPIFYDSDNTAYFMDLSTNNDSIVARGTIHIGPEGNLGLGDLSHPKIAYPGESAQWGGAGTTTGQIIIDLPGTLASYDMAYIEIDVFEYDSKGGAKIIIGSHNWNSGADSGTSNTMWYATDVRIVGRFDHEIYLGWRNNGSVNKRVIVLGTHTSSWSYGTVHVSKVHGATYYTNSIDWTGDWNISQNTSSSAYTKSPTTNWNDSDSRNLRVHRSIQGNRVYGDADIRSPIFYDLDNTGYYTNPASTSLMNGIQLAGSLLFTAEGATNIKTRFIMGKASGSTSSGQLYLNYGQNYSVNIGTGATADLNVTGAISSGAITSSVNSGQFHARTTSDPSNYYAKFNANYNYAKAFSIQARGAGNEIEIMTWGDGAGLEFNGGANSIIKFSGDNLSSIGTISSGAITSTGNSTHGGYSSWTAGNGTGGIFMHYNATNAYRGYFDWRTLQLGNNGANNILAGNSSTGGYFKFWVNATGISQSGGTSGINALTISAAGNSTFSGSIDSGAITSTGNIIHGTNKGIGSGTIGISASNATGYFGMLPFNPSTSAYRDGSMNLGGYNRRFGDIFATNSTIVTSDRNEKQDIENLSDAETRVAVACKGLIKKFRWKSAVEEKGDNARIHFGIVAQELEAAFEAESLNAERYGMFTSNTWTDEDTGEERTLRGVRYSELLAFIISAI
jgi:hypothetical protein